MYLNRFRAMADVLRTLPPTLSRSVTNALLAGVVVAIISLFLPNRFRAEARILPGDVKGSMAAGQMAAAAAAIGGIATAQEGADSTYIDILNSRWMAKRLLEAEYSFSTRAWLWGSKVEHRETLNKFLKISNPDRGYGKIHSMLKVNRDLKTRLLTIGIETDSPELSQAIIANSIKALEAFVLTKSQTKGGKKAAFTAVRLKEAEQAREAAEREYLQFLDIHRNFATSNEPSVRLRGAGLDANLKLRQQVVATLTLNLEQALIEEKNDMPILNILDEPEVASEKSGPPRTVMVLLSVLFVGLGTAAFLFTRSNPDWFTTPRPR